MKFHKTKQSFFSKFRDVHHETDFHDIIYSKKFTPSEKLERLKYLCYTRKEYINYYYCGYTPLQYCILYFPEGAIELLKNRANPNSICKGFLNNSTLEYAMTVRKNDSSLHRLLGFYGANSPSSNIKFANTEIEEAYSQGYNVFLNNKPIDILIAAEKDPAFKVHYMEAINFKIAINSSTASACTEKSTLLNYKTR